jgi:RNA polymerase sigma-70 factor (ECF subfamily)
MLDPVVERAQSGDQAAWKELFARHRTDVARVVQRTLGPSPDVEDVVQDVFVHLFRSIGSFRGDSKFSTWVFRIAWNVARMHIRRLQARPRLVGAVQDERLEGEFESAEQTLDRNARVAALYRLVEGLSEKKAEVLILHDFHGKSPAEISEVVDAPVLTVRTRLFYARKELYSAILADSLLGPHVGSLEELLPGKPVPRDRSGGATESDGAAEEKKLRHRESAP